MSAAMTMSVMGQAAEGDIGMSKRSLYLIVVLVVAAATAAVFWIHDNIATREEEGRQIVFKIVNLTEQTADPREWGKNFPRQ